MNEKIQVVNNVLVEESIMKYKVILFDVDDTL
ncbi:noncanonical pyrimidine nucleotidase, YjjG family, partial [Bacillus wiedmannii]